VTGWAAGERREAQVYREVYLSRSCCKEVVVQEKGAIEAQEEDGMDVGQRKVCPWGMLIRRSWGMGERSFWCVCV
jgi:hypothetical protein